ncbi:hypothetical protein [Hymenobacter cheonanensis]|uniref:hypothetical protein n=1 Tax=Hymenobacter sp. CA2-7 TaxID=3063993 RepID=UPI0027140B64|nr:hypothetical protein [Hymenobacter sp. CA2-7]MDO7887106.1 hypothetical protein [Hymenobacter sp. CA2-7]
MVPKVELQLRRWSGEPIADSFGGKPVIDFAGRPMFAELAVYELFRLSGWEARWIETYGAPTQSPKHYVDWHPSLPKELRKTQLHQAIADEEMLTVLQKAAAANGGSFAGCWDVLGWQGDKLIFAECKRHRKDKLQATQPRWLQAGLAAGLQPENFLLVEWDFLA